MVMGLVWRGVHIFVLYIYDIYIYDMCIIAYHITFTRTWMLPSNAVIDDSANPKGDAGVDTRRKMFLKSQHRRFGSLTHILGGGNSNISYFHPENWGRFPIWRAYFSNGLVQPPTSIWHDPRHPKSSSHTWWGSVWKEPPLKAFHLRRCE